MFPQTQTNTVGYGKRAVLRIDKKIFLKVTALPEEMNQQIVTRGVKFNIREEYAIEYLEQISNQYISITGLQSDAVIRGRGHIYENETGLHG